MSIVFVQENKIVFWVFTINCNTWIIKGITSNDITVSGSENFDNSNIESNLDDIYVVPIEGEDDSYIVSKNEFEERQKENKIPVFTPFEWASPVLKFNPESISKIISLFDRGLGKLFYVNDSCGFHHHISFVFQECF